MFFLINTDVLLKNFLLKFKIHVEISFVSVVILSMRALCEALLNCGQYEGVYKNGIFCIC